ncbi:MAG: cytochrome c-type biogenesis protein [Planktomarina sp.]
MIRALITVVLLSLAIPAAAVEVDEILDDPVLEKRARSLSATLRCLQCRNESIDESKADVARDLRLLVRERLVQGDSDTEVLDFVVNRYGEYVLLHPNGTGANLVLWLSGPALLLLTLLGLAVVRGTSTNDATTPPLSPAEEAELAKLLAAKAGDRDQ